MPAVIFDIICALVIIITIIVCAWKGFLSSILSLAGTLVAVVAAFFISRAAAVPLFEALFRDRLVERTATSIESYGAYSLQELVDSISGLPDAVGQAILSNFGNQYNFDTQSFAASVVDEVVAPMLIPVIAIGIFILLFILFRILVAILTKVFRGANRVPVLGAANRIFGGVAGLCIGLLYVFLIVMIVQVITLLSSGYNVLDSAEGLMNGIIASFMDGSADAARDSLVNSFQNAPSGIFSSSFFYKTFTGISIL